MTSIVPKSGCAPTRKRIDHKINKNGRNHHSRVPRYFLFCLKKAARYTTKANFKNSVGWILKGIPGIESQPVAHL